MTDRVIDLKWDALHVEFSDNSIGSGNAVLLDQVDELLIRSLTQRQVGTLEEITDSLIPLPNHFEDSANAQAQKELARANTISDYQSALKRWPRDSILNEENDLDGDRVADFVNVDMDGNGTTDFRVFSGAHKSGHANLDGTMTVPFKDSQNAEGDTEFVTYADEGNGGFVATLVEVGDHAWVPGMERTTAHELSRLDQIAESSSSRFAWVDGVYIDTSTVNAAAEQIAAERKAQKEAQAEAATAAAAAAATRDGGGSGTSGEKASGSATNTSGLSGGTDDADDTNDAKSPTKSGGLSGVKVDGTVGGAGDVATHYDYYAPPEDDDASATRPILLDLDGDGIEINRLSASTQVFDFDGDGLANRAAWAGADHGLLVHDIGDDGVAFSDGTTLLGGENVGEVRKAA